MRSLPKKHRKAENVPISEWKFDYGFLLLPRRIHPKANNSYANQHQEKQFGE